MVSLKGMVATLVIAIVGLVVIMSVAGETVDDIQTAGNLINATGAPLAGLFAGDSVVPLLFLAGVLLAVVGLALGIAKGRD